MHWGVEVPKIREGEIILQVLTIISQFVADKLRNCSRAEAF